MSLAQSQRPMAATAQPAVSIIVPAYNAAATLREAVESVQAQSFRDWQLVIIDDGSSDGTLALARDMAAADPRLVVLAQANAGPSAARNAGILVGSGAFLCFLDSDDWLPADFLDRMIAALRENRDATVACCTTEHVLPDGQRITAPVDPMVVTDPMVAFRRSCAICIHAMMVRRAVLDDVGLFDVGLRIAEDWDLLMRMARNGAQFVFVPELTVPYRVRSGSLMHDIPRLVQDTIEVMRRGGQPDARVRRDDPRFAACHMVTQEEDALWTHLWAIGHAVGRGVDAAEFLPAGVRMLDCRHYVTAVAETVLHALCLALPATREDMAARVSEFDARLQSAAMFIGSFSSDPSLGQHIYRQCAARLLLHADHRAPARIGSVQLSEQRLAAIRPVVRLAGVESVLLRYRGMRGWPPGIEAPLLGDLTATDVARITLSQPGEGLTGGDMLRLLAGSPLRRQWRVARRLVRQAPALTRRMLRVTGGARGKQWRNIAVKALRATLRDAVAGEAPGAGADCEIAVIEAARAAAAACVPLSSGQRRGDRSFWQFDPHSQRRDYWEAVFETRDPWNYGSAYEQVKYARTLSLLPDAPIGQALELACAEGLFSRMLAPRVASLTATDVSARALARARDHCGDLPNIAFRPLDFVAQPLPPDLDLIVCSEVLYYLPDRQTLDRLAAKMRDALAPGGMLLTAHALLLVDDRSRTGFDWEHPFGAATIGAAFAGAGLVLERSIRTEIYRIDLFRRPAPGAAVLAPQVETLPLGTPLEPDVAKHVIEGGTITRRADVRPTEQTRRIPILMYHSIAADGPAALARWRVSPEAFAAQMGLLRRHGYHAVTSAEVLEHLRAERPFAGRPVMLTFDDGLRDFAENAWPVLQGHDFTAEVFIPTGHVGGTAAWEAAGGGLALMGWGDIAALHREGVVFGSHLVSHAATDAMDSRQLLREAAESRAALERATGAPVTSVAYPYGAMDPRCWWTMSRAGYTLGLKTNEEVATLDHDPLGLPRLEVHGGMDLDSFAAKVFQARGGA